MSDRVITNNNNNHNNQSYYTVESLSKGSAFLFYIKSIGIGLWVLLKWILFFLWRNVSHKSAEPNYDGYHDKPPSILVDNKLGRHSYVKLKGVKFHYVETGNCGNPLIVLLHGFPDCWIGWHNQILGLSKFFRVVSIDLKGFNDSDKPNWRGGYSPIRICQELRQFIFSLGCNTATIIGHDLGGLIGWYFAHTNPENIERFICISAPHPNLIWENLHPKCVMNKSWLHFVQLPFVPELDHSSAHSNFLQKCFISIFMEKDKSSLKKSQDKLGSYNKTNLQDSYKYIFNRRNDWTGPLNYYRSFPFYRIQEGCTIRCPVLLVTGNEDDVCRLESIIKSTDFCNNPIVKIIEGSGHWPHRQTPEEFNKIILNFLVGRRADSEPILSTEKNTKSIMGRVFGAVTSSVKIGSSVFDSVHQKTNDVLSTALY